MNVPVRRVVAVLLGGIWVNASEFFRNEILLKTYWIEHYRSLGLSFPSAPVNGILWMVWGFLFAAAIYCLTRRFDLLQSTLIGWLVAFILMWLVIFNLNVLPPGVLAFAVPLSFLETFLAAYICIRISPAAKSRGKTLRCFTKERP